MPAKWEAVPPGRKSRDRWAKAGGIMGLLRLRMTALTKDVKNDCTEYEPPASPTYLRTMTLAGSWSSDVRGQGNDLLGLVLSSGKVAPYNRWVRGTKTQVGWMARRGWRTVKTIVGLHWPRAKQDFERILKAA